MNEPTCHACGQPLADIDGIQQKLRELMLSCPTAEMGELAYLMTRQLHIAVHGGTWARPRSTEQVWLDLLRTVGELSKAGNRGEEKTG